jgi:ribosomal-protein-alanine N-acetyltransferase
LRKEAEDELIVRRASKGDLGVVYEIERRSFKDPYPAFFIEMLLTLNPDTFLVAQKEERIVGYVVATKDRSTGHIVSIAVAPEEREKQVGRSLMENILEVLQKVEVETIRLEVRRSNLAAQKFYESQGFVYNHEVSGYYGNEDAFVYYKSFQRIL